MAGGLAKAGIAGPGLGWRCHLTTGEWGGGRQSQLENSLSRQLGIQLARPVQLFCVS
jgi:hypothetical protein